MLESQKIHLSPDDAFKALSNSRRRQVILSLSQSENPVPAGALAREIAARENEIDLDQVTGKQRSRVYIGLIQSHLGLLDDLGVIEFNDRTKHVTATDETQPLASYIQQLKRNCQTTRGDA
jgi:DNA-binding transcriptional ArsR family regulator